MEFPSDEVSNTSPSPGAALAGTLVQNVMCPVASAGEAWPSADDALFASTKEKFGCAPALKNTPSTLNGAPGNPVSGVSVMCGRSAATQLSVRLSYSSCIQ